MGWRILGGLLSLWGGTLIVRWLLQGMPIYFGTSYGMGLNAGLVIAFIMFGLGILIFKRSFKKEEL